MNPPARSSRPVSGFAAAAMSIAALAAMWAEGDSASAARTLAAADERPAADAPVSVVKAPPAVQARHWPASCLDCPALPLREVRL